MSEYLGYIWYDNVLQFHFYSIHFLSSLLFMQLFLKILSRMANSLDPEQNTPSVAA